MLDALSPPEPRRGPREIRERDKEIVSVFGTILVELRPDPVPQSIGHCRRAPNR
jgi:hypothetical protein